MNEEVQKLLEEADRRATIANQNRLLGTKFKATTTKSVNGGQFEVTPEFIAAIQDMIDQGDDETVLLDRNDVPIRITNLSEFLEELRSLYKEAINELYFNQNRLRKSRNAKQAIGET